MVLLMTFAFGPIAQPRVARAQDGALANPGSSMERDQFGRWAAVNGAAAVFGFATAAIIDASGPVSAAPCRAESTTCGDYDRSVEGYFSNVSHQVSNVTLATALFVPALAQLGEFAGDDFSSGASREFAKAVIIEGQAVSATLAVNTLVKVIVRRPRPYMFGAHRDVVTFCEGKREEGDADVSFPSGHSASAFAGAMAGSLLYTARTDDRVARHVMWGAEFALAAATAELRVFGGRHYRSDVLAGSVLGAGLGLLVPWLHGVGTPRVQASEALTGVGAAVATVALLESVHALMPDSWLWKPGVSVKPTEPQTSAASWSLAPKVGALGVGLDVVGAW